MSFGSDIARGVAAQLFLIFAVIFIAGGAVAMGLYFGISWLVNHVVINVV